MIDPAFCVGDSVQRNVNGARVAAVVLAVTLRHGAATTYTLRYDETTTVLGVTEDELRLAFVLDKTLRGVTTVMTNPPLAKSRLLPTVGPRRSPSRSYDNGAETRRQSHSREVAPTYAAAAGEGAALVLPPLAAAAPEPHTRSMTLVEQVRALRQGLDALKTLTSRSQSDAASVLAELSIASTELDDVANDVKGAHSTVAGARADLFDVERSRARAAAVLSNSLTRTREETVPVFVRVHAAASDVNPPPSALHEVTKSAGPTCQGGRRAAGRAAIVSSLRGEPLPDLVDWCRYHLALGFDTLYLYFDALTESQIASPPPPPAASGEATTVPALLPPARRPRPRAADDDDTATARALREKFADDARVCVLPGCLAHAPPAPGEKRLRAASSDEDGHEFTSLSQWAELAPAVANELIARQVNMIYDAIVLIREVVAEEFSLRASPLTATHRAWRSPADTATLCRSCASARVDSGHRVAPAHRHRRAFLRAEPRCALHLRAGLGSQPLQTALPTGSGRAQTTAATDRRFTRRAARRRRCRGAVAGGVLEPRGRARVRERRRALLAFSRAHHAGQALAAGPARGGD